MNDLNLVTQNVVSSAVERRILLFSAKITASPAFAGMTEMETLC